MGELVVSVISLIILVPIIYFLPLGLTNKGKGLLIIIAFIFANVGILAKGNFPIWQTALILLLLTVLTVYILDKRFHHLLFLKKNEKLSEPLLYNEEFVTYEEENKEAEEMSLEQFEQHNLSFVQEEELVSEERLLEIEQMEDLGEETNVGDRIEKDDEEIVDPPFLTGKNDEMSGIEKSTYMTEIEMLLESEELENFPNNIETLDIVAKNSFSPQSEVVNLEDSDRKEDDASSESGSQEAEAVAQETPLLESIILEEAFSQLDLAHKEIAAGNEGAMSFLQTESLEHHSLHKTAEATTFAALEESSYIDSDRDDGDENLQFDIKNRVIIAEGEQRTSLQQQIMQTMVSQIDHARKQMTPHEFEKYVKEYLHPEISAQDYYTFASILIEHYIRQKELNKLQGLLADLREKFTDYPVLQMEIQYLFKQYCEKIS
ncbi:hypothetical protein PZE06_01695 [Robertmurraya sp. DFI.2.37]|uniref:hypothetical protein n=1 Tax=Robertmurraya sp. DFI.2.37 TaxID=3031819 RepID=UPI001249398F|nr:hypothetical protein [Robertmurraya sp. DFI.2.37]MDF1506888.1 hypothetical protein [Robertmurraya sp. DFI.2.37]